MAYAISIFTDTSVLYQSSTPTQYVGNSGEKFVVPSSCPFTTIDFTATIIPQGYGHRWMVSYGPEHYMGLSVGVCNGKLRCDVMGTYIEAGSLPNDVTSVVRMTWDGTTLECYINGNIVGSEKTSVSEIPCSTELWISGEQYGGGRFWYRGSMDKVILRTQLPGLLETLRSVSYTHLRAHETHEHLLCRRLL
mgnify:CR=1 FL=1